MMENMMKMHRSDKNLFYYDNLGEEQVILNEETSRHIISVLRLNTGDSILLTDGKGTQAAATIVDNNKKKCSVRLTEKKFTPRTSIQVAIGISLIKNTSRFEWFLEKATEIGVSEIYPMICERTEKEHFRLERMDGIITSAMLQSKQRWKPQLHQPTPFTKIISNDNYHQQFIAHCIEDKDKINLKAIKLTGNAIILIGPEGDFTDHEVSLAKDFANVSLGPTRLRTETAGIVAAAFLC